MTHSKGEKPVETKERELWVYSTQRRFLDHLATGALSQAPGSDTLTAHESVDGTHISGSHRPHQNKIAGK